MEKTTTNTANRATLRRKTTANANAKANRKNAMVEFLGVDSPRHNLKEFAEHFALEYKGAHAHSHSGKKGGNATCLLDGKWLSIEHLCNYLGIDYKKRKCDAPKNGTRSTDPTAAITKAVETLEQIGLTFSKTQTAFIEKVKYEIIAKANAKKAEAANAKKAEKAKTKALNAAASLSLAELEMLIKSKR